MKAEGSDASQRSDVFLDFMDPDNHTLYGIRGDGRYRDDVRLAEVLRGSLNVAALLCDRRCLMPPFFAIESGPVRTALARSSAYLEERLIQMPSRESTIGDLLERKMSEYAMVKDNYTGLFADGGVDFLAQHSSALTYRHLGVGKTLASMWTEGVDGELWLPIKQQFTARDVDRLVARPGQLLDQGQSLTETGVLSVVAGAPTVAPLIGYVLQHNYTATYLSHYGAEILRGAPPKTTDLGLESGDLLYDFDCFRSVAEILGLWPSVAQMSAEQVLIAREDLGFNSFLREYAALCRESRNVRDVLQSVAVAWRRTRPDLAGATLTSRLRRPWTPGQTRLSPRGYEVLSDQLLGVADQLSQVRSMGIEAVTSALAKGISTRMTKRVFVVHGQDHVTRDRIRIHLTGKGLEVSVMEEQPFAGRTLPEKFEELAQTSDYVVAIATADDEMSYAGSTASIRRARQNVMIEIGFFWGLFGRRGRFSLLADPAIEMPTDLQGIGYIALTPDLGMTLLSLDRELVEAGLVTSS